MAGVEAKDLVIFLWDDDLPEHENTTQAEDAVRVLLKNEMKLMNAMDWNLCIPTALDFLHHSFQFATIACPDLFYTSDFPIEKGGQCSLMNRRYSRELFFKGASILDKCVMDYQHLEFVSSLLAAAVFYKVIMNESTKS